MLVHRTLGVLGAAVLVGAGGVALAPAAQAADGTVTVVHGIPGLTVDVYVNGDETLPNFAPGTVTDPLTLPAGSYKIDIFADGEGPGGTPAITDTVELPSGANASVVAYLGTDGKPSSKLGVFVNDTSAIDAGQARVTVRHVAAAPAVKVTADGTTLIESLSNPDEASADVPAKTYAVEVAPASGGAAVFSTDLALPEGASTIVYAYGALDAGTFAVATQSITGLGSAPTGVPAGEGPATPLDGGTGSTPILVLAAIAAAVALWSGVRLVRARS
jgi:hypothetical protein